MSACSGTALRSEGDAEGRTSRNLAEIVRFGTWVQTLDDAKLDEQYERMLMQHRASPSNDMAIKLSLVLSRRGAQAGALAEAMALLMEVRDGQDEDAELGRILYQFISERHLAATANTSLSALLSEERERATRLETELMAARATLETAERERAALVQQLDALKAIEARIALPAAPKVP
ncbi:MAG TPA: hypothetical protein VKA43_04550 [Gammaproteobacteria bacterium]|nr:hypothetical protein [Gammaproteobacteria bacterium]